MSNEALNHSGISRRGLLLTTTRLGVALASVGGLSTLLDACGTNNSSTGGQPQGSTGAATQTITIGGLISQTGAVAAVGKAVGAGAQLRFQLANQQGGIKSLGGAQLAFKIQDDQSNPQQAPSAVDQLTSANVPLIIGGVSSTAMLNASTEADRSGVPLINAVGVDASLTARGLQHFFTTCGSSTLYSNDFVVNTKSILDSHSYKPKNVVVLYETQVQGPLYAAALKPAFSSITDWNVTFTGYDPTVSDMTPVVAKLKQSGADVVVLCSYPSDGVLLLQAMKGQNYVPEYLTGCMGGILSAEFASGAGPLVSGFAGESYWVDDPKIPGNSDLRKAYAKANGGSTSIDVFTAMGYAAGCVAVDALERAASTDRDRVTSAMRATSMSPGQSGLNLPGGVKFDDHGANTAVKGVYYEYDGTKQVAVLPAEFASAKPTFPHGAWK